MTSPAAIDGGPAKGALISATVRNTSGRIERATGCHRRAEVVADDACDGAMTKRRDQSQRVADQVEHAEGIEIAIEISIPSRGASIAALVRRDDVKSGARQRQHHLAPAVGELRESVEQQNAGAALRVSKPASSTCIERPLMLATKRERIPCGSVPLPYDPFVSFVSRLIGSTHPFISECRNLSLRKLISQPRAHEELPARPAAICRPSGYIGTAKRGPIERSQGESATTWSRVHQGKRRRQNHLRPLKSISCRAARPPHARRSRIGAKQSAAQCSASRSKRCPSSSRPASPRETRGRCALPCRNRPRIRSREAEQQIDASPSDHYSIYLRLAGQTVSSMNDAIFTFNADVSACTTGPSRFGRCMEGGAQSRFCPAR